MERTVDDLIPLNVKTYGQGLLKLQGWMIFSCLAFLTAGLLVTYEVSVYSPYMLFKQLHTSLYHEET